MSEFLRRTVLARLAEVGIPLQPNEGRLEDSNAWKGNCDRTAVERVLGASGAE
jgi:hypothetical protein